jgi:hypothetical protein
MVDETKQEPKPKPTPKGPTLKTATGPTLKKTVAHVEEVKIEE